MKKITGLRMFSLIRRINNLRFTDDTVLLTSSEESLLELIHRVEVEGEKVLISQKQPLIIGSGLTRDEVERRCNMAKVAMRKSSETKIYL